MVRRTLGCAVLIALLVAFSTAVASAQTAPRVAFVVGNGAYVKAPLPLSLNDAGLVAEALRTVGFDIVEGADLTQADFVRTFRDFLGKLEAAGPDATAFVYFSGYGFAFDGDNFLVAVDARLGGEHDIPLDAMRLSDVLRALDGSPARAKIVAIDAARRLPFGIASFNLASGLAAIEAPRGMLIAYSAEPGTLVEDGRGPYGPYTTAVAEMIRIPGLNMVDAFPRIRARTHQLTEGRQLPWSSSALGTPLVFVPSDPAGAVADARPLVRRPRPMVELGPDEAYGLAIETDDLPTYVEYLDAYPASPHAPRIWAAVRARREALAWMRAVDINSPQAYWTYLRRYPNGIYAADAGRRLRRLSAPLAPPAAFLAIDFVGVPPPLAQEPPAVIPYYRSPPQPPARLIEPPPALFASLPPPRRAGARVLPVSASLPALPRVSPGSRMGIGSVSPPGMANRRSWAAFGPTGPATLPRSMTRPAALQPNTPAPPPHGTFLTNSGSAQSAPVATPLTHQPAFQPSRRQGHPPPGTYGIPPTQSQTFQPSRRHGQPATAVAPSVNQPQTFTRSRRQGETMPGSGAAPAINRPPPSHVTQPTLPAISRPAAPQTANRPSQPVVHAAPPPAPVARVIRPPAPIRQAVQPPQTVRQTAPAKKCVVENGSQVCR